MAGEVRVTGKDTLGLSNLNDLDGVSPASLDDNVCESLGAVDALCEMVGAEDFRRPTKLSLAMGAFLELDAIGMMLGFVPRLTGWGELRAEPRSLVVAA